MASSVSVPPNIAVIPCSLYRANLASRLPVAMAVPQPSLTMSM